MSGKTNFSTASDLNSTSDSLKSVALSQLSTSKTLTVKTDEGLASFLISTTTLTASYTTSIFTNFIESRGSTTFFDEDKSNFKVLKTSATNATKKISIIADGVNKESTEKTNTSRPIFQGESLNYYFMVCFLS